MPSNTKDLFLHWGKSSPDGNFHSALCHMIDVGCVAENLLGQPGWQNIAGMLRDPFLECDILSARRFLAYLAAIHDIGKVSPGFQSKREELVSNEVKLHIPASGKHETNHGMLTWISVCVYLQRLGVSHIPSNLLSWILGSHHGEFLKSWRGKVHIPGLEPAFWQEQRECMLSLLAETFEVTVPKQFFSDGRFSSGWMIWLTGFVNLCDWLGSSEEYFPAIGVPEGGLEGYLLNAREKAAQAVRNTGFHAYPAFDHPSAFPTLFPGFPSPNQIQTATIDLVSGTTTPRLLLIEAPMGMGKTEAALAASDAMAAAHGKNGLYVALPTQATSNQMFGRVKEFLGNHPEVPFHTDIHLVHGSSLLNREYRKLRHRENEPGDTSSLVAREWFMGRKRQLLSPFGVGTIDQALLGALQVRHVGLRLFGLGSKVVIFDEVHAYDAYMSSLLDRLLQWLHALGADVVLLSATLPQKRRMELLATFTDANHVVPATSGYPLLSAVFPSGEVSESVLEIQKRHEVKWERLSPPVPSQSEEIHLESVVDTVLARIERGGCAAWICNTIQNAQETYSLIREKAENDIEVFLFHARFPLSDRLSREQEVLERFGKSSSNRPNKAILVATQVIEQSLDLDFDFMVSELAPIDLMLQRMGRLHRHRRGYRPPGLETPCFAWIDPPVQSGVPQLGTSGFVYEPYVLLRTWLTIRDRSNVSIPADMRELVEAVYGENTEPADITEELTEVLRNAKLGMQKREGVARQSASNQLMPDPADSIFQRIHQAIDDEGESGGRVLQMHTRLTRPSVTLVCLHEKEGSLYLPTGIEVSLQDRPDEEMVEQLHLATVSLQHFEWVRHFLSHPCPTIWKQIPYLRYCRIAVFHDGVLRAEDSHKTLPPLQLCVQRGLIVPKP